MSGMLIHWRYGFLKTTDMMLQQITFTDIKRGDP